MLEIAFAFIFNSGSVGNELVDPKPIAVDKTMSVAQVRFASIDGIERVAGWSSRIANDGTVEAHLSIRDHEATVRVTATLGQVDISYVSSRNLDYEEKDKKRTIHKHYMLWTQELADSITAAMRTVCPDISQLLRGEGTGLPYDEAMRFWPVLASYQVDGPVTSSTGKDTGYRAREFTAFLGPDATASCSPATLITYDERVVATIPAPAGPASVALYGQLLTHLVSTGRLSVGDAEVERVTVRLNTSLPLTSQRREEILRYVEWQADRVTMGEVSQKEYQFLLAQKESELLERQQTLEAKQAELQLLQRGQLIQQQQLAAQQQTAASQRSMAITAALSNFTRTMSDISGRSTVQRPTFRSTSCRTRALGATVYTDCDSR